MLQELLLIFLINYLGIVLSEIFHLPIPGTITGMFLLFGALYFKVIKLSQIEKTGNWLLLNMTVFFLPPSISLLENLALLKTGFLKIMFLLVVSTIITMIITAVTVQYMIKRGEKK